MRVSQFAMASAVEAAPAAPAVEAAPAATKAAAQAAPEPRIAPAQSIILPPEAFNKV